MDFELPPSLEAVAPPEERGRGRDDVRLMEARRSSGLIAHHQFQALPDLLRPGDLLVVNPSATISAAGWTFVTALTDSPAHSDIASIAQRRERGLDCRVTVARRSSQAGQTSRIEQKHARWGIGGGH